MLQTDLISLNLRKAPGEYVRNAKESRLWFENLLASGTTFLLGLQIRAFEPTSETHLAWLGEAALNLESVIGHE